MSLSFIGTAYAASEPAAGGAFPPFDASTFGGQLFWLVVIFGAIYALMSKVALPRVEGILADRKTRIESDLDQAAKTQQAAEAATEAYELKLASARANAQSISQTARDVAAKDAAAHKAKTEADLAAKLEAAERSIAETKAKAMSNVEAIAKDAAAAVVERLTGVAPKAADIAGAIAALSGKK